MINDSKSIQCVPVDGIVDVVDAVDRAMESSTEALEPNIVVVEAVAVYHGTCEPIRFNSNLLIPSHMTDEVVLE